MAKIRITPKYYELQAMDVAVEEDGDVTMEMKQSSSPEPCDHGFSAGHERAASAEPEDHRLGDEDGEDEEYPVRRNYERAASVEPEELEVRRSYGRAASVEPEEHEVRMAYERAASCEPDHLRHTTMDDKCDVPTASRPAPPPPRFRVEDYINVESWRKIPPSIYKEVMKARQKPSLGTTSPNVWLQRKTWNTATLPTLRQGLIQRDIMVVERTRYFKGEGSAQAVRVFFNGTSLEDLEERNYGATMLDPSVMYKMTKDGVAVEQLQLTMEFVLSEK